MPSALIIEVEHGADYARTLTLLDRNRSVEGFTGSETLACTAWTGDDQAALFEPVAAWKDPKQAQITLAVTAAQTADLLPGLYRLDLAVTANGLTRRKQLGFLRLLAGPGTATALKTYCSFDDCLRYAPWIMDLVTADPSMQSDLGEQRARARSWLDEIILTHDRPSELMRFGMSPSDPHYSPRWGWGRYGDNFINPWLRDQLAKDKLIVRPMTVEICARKAISLVCEPQLGKAGGDNGTPYQELARRYDLQSQALIAGYIAEINTSNLPNDQVYAAGYLVRCGQFSIR